MRFSSPMVEYDIPKKQSAMTELSARAQVFFSKHRRSQGLDKMGEYPLVMIVL
jgi:hypothetical protein